MSLSQSLERYRYDVVIIGAGGAGLRAAIEARGAGLRVAIICKSLLGKAHTVMAEGGIAAAMGNVNENDGWKVHFRDTMRGGKFLNNWRMAELHAKESPDCVWELETWGALFDRTKDGRISQRNFGGHEYPRLAHVADRTGLELIRTLQQKIVGMQQDDTRIHGDAEKYLKVFQELTITEIFKDGGKVSGAYGYWRETGSEVLFEAPAVILATGGIGKSFKITSNSWEGTGDGHALAVKAGGSLVDMEFVQFHPTGMVWPPSVRGILVTESVRGDGGILTNSNGERFMFNYIPAVFKDKYADNEAEADRWYSDQKNNRRPPELLPRDEVARAINAEVKAGRGSPNGGVFLDVSKRLPLGVSDVSIKNASEHLNEPFTRGGNENPYTIHQELQELTHNLVGIIRTKSELEEALVKLSALETRSKKVHATGGKAFNPGFHLALDLENMLIVSQCIARAALEREESRGGHTRDDFPKMDSKWRQINHLCTWDGKKVIATKEKAKMLPFELFELFELEELKNYYTGEEITSVKGGTE